MRVWLRGQLASGICARSMSCEPKRAWARVGFRERLVSGVPALPGLQAEPGQVRPPARKRACETRPDGWAGPGGSRGEGLGPGFAADCADSHLNPSPGRRLATPGSMLDRLGARHRDDQLNSIAIKAIGFGQACELTLGPGLVRGCSGKLSLDSEWAKKREPHESLPVLSSPVLGELQLDLSHASVRADVKRMALQARTARRVPQRPRKSRRVQAVKVERDDVSVRASPVEAADAPTAQWPPLF